MVYWLIALLAAIITLGLFLIVKRRKARKPTAQATYGGPIRFTDPSGRNMRIVQKDDGSFEMMEE
jgi:hypothetical protein